MASTVNTSNSFADTKPKHLREIELEGELLRQWLVLNYYDERANGEHLSQIVNDDFFISPEGRVNPFAEFAAFKELLNTSTDLGTDAEALCRFPARLRLFRNYGQLPPNWHSPSCEDFEQQIQPESISSISLIFASGYFDNPSSYYGHTLLKFHYADELFDQADLDSSLKYGADVTDNPSSPFYIVRGLFGGYTASYSRNNYFLHTYLYTNAQLRDTWEYELNLTFEQIQFVVEHSWEMTYARFKYYFFSDNCAHRIARLLELSTGRDLSDTHGFWLLPTQVVRKLRTQNPRDDFINREIYNPSLKTLFSAHFDSLDRNEKSQFIRFFEMSNEDKSQTLPHLQTELLLLTIDYLDLEVAKLTLKEEAEDSISDLHRQRALVLSEMFRRPVRSANNSSSNFSIGSPIEMKPPSTLRIGTGIRHDRSFHTIGYRVANNDFMNEPNPGQEISKFIMGEIEFEVDHGSAELSRVTLVELVNVNTNPLPTRMTQERSWSFVADYSSRTRLCSDCSNFGLETTMGRSTRPNHSVVLYGFAGGRLHTTGQSSDGFFTLTSEVGSVINVTERAILKLSGEGYVDTSSSEIDWLWKVEFAFNPIRNFDFRLSFESNGHQEAMLASVAYYFD